MKLIETSIVIKFAFFESLTDTDCTNFGQLVSVLKDDSKIKLDFNHSYYNYKPLNGEFYTQLKNSKCKVTRFAACVTSSEHLSIIRRSYRGADYNLLSISTVSASEVSFATLERYGGILRLRIKYTDDCPSTGSNPVTGKTILTIADIPADGRDNVFKIIKYISPKSKKFLCLYLDNCHLTDADTNELLKKVEGERIRTRWRAISIVGEMRVNEDKSRDLELHLTDIGQRKAEQRQTERRETEQREAEQREAEQREGEQREGEQREAEQREDEKLRAKQREAEQQEFEARKTEAREAELREAIQKEPEQQEPEESKIKSKGKVFKNLFRKF